MRALSTLLTAALFFGGGLACTAGGAGPVDDSGVPTTTGQAGSTGTGSGTGGSTQPTGSPTPTGSSTGAAGQPSTGSGSAGRVGTGDNGDLFDPDAAVPANTLPSSTAGSTGTGTPDASTSTPEGGSGISGDGHMATAHSGGFTLLFTQKGHDVTLVISGCTGTHKVEVHEGYACDDPTKGPVWGGARGTGIFNAASMFTCDATTKSATYTRSGADPKTSWTVADHNPTTDVTLHPILVDTSCGTFF